MASVLEMIRNKNEKISSAIFFIIAFVAVQIFYARNAGAQSSAAKLPYQNKQSFVVTQGYNSPPTHIHKDSYALDFTQNGCDAYGKDILSANPGKVWLVEEEGYNGGYGTEVLVLGDDDVVSRYAHLVQGSISVNKGDEVKTGAVLGMLGNTGLVMGAACAQHLGAHLHFAMYDKNADGSFSARNPEPISGYADIKEGAWYVSDNGAPNVGLLGDIGAIAARVAGGLLNVGSGKSTTGSDLGTTDGGAISIASSLYGNNGISSVSGTAPASIIAGISSSSDLSSDGNNTSVAGSAANEGNNIFLGQTTTGSFPIADKNSSAVDSTGTLLSQGGQIAQNSSGLPPPVAQNIPALSVGYNGPSGGVTAVLPGASYTSTSPTGGSSTAISADDTDPSLVNIDLEKSPSGISSVDSSDDDMASSLATSNDNGSVLSSVPSTEDSSVNTSTAVMDAQSIDDGSASSSEEEIDTIVSDEAAASSPESTLFASTTSTADPSVINIDDMTSTISTSSPSIATSTASSSTAMSPSEAPPAPTFYLTPPTPMAGEDAIATFNSSTIAIDFAWTAPQDASGSSNGITYSIIDLDAASGTADGDASGVSLLWTGASTEFSYSVSKGGIDYHFGVRAVDAAGDDSFATATVPVPDWFTVVQQADNNDSHGSWYSDNWYDLGTGFYGTIRALTLEGYIDDPRFFKSHLWIEEFLDPGYTKLNRQFAVSDDAPFTNVNTKITIGSLNIPLEPGKYYRLDTLQDCQNRSVILKGTTAIGTAMWNTFIYGAGKVPYTYSFYPYLSWVFVPDFPQYVPPNPPTDIITSLDPFPGKLDVSWSTATDPDTAPATLTYDINCGTSSMLDPLNWQSVGGMRFGFCAIDTTKTYYIGVCAVDGFGNYSGVATKEWTFSADLVP